MMLIASVLLLGHPYTGIRHDGILYAGDALSYLVGGQLQKDLYFLYGSQGQFTVLPWAYSKLLALFGLGLGPMLGLLAAFSLYLAASWFLLKAIAPRSLVFYCLMSVVLGWTLYGGLRVFAYSEAFLTARSFAEPFILFAIGLIARRRMLLASLALAAALALHPLMGLTGLIVVWLLLAWDDRRWLWLAAAAPIAFLLLALHPAGPFADLLSRYDATWLGLVEEANPQAFILHWTPFDGGLVFFDVCVLWFITRCAEDRFLERLAMTVVIAGLASVALSFIGADVLHSAFIAKLQIWRTLWITHWVSMALLPLVLRDQWQSGSHGRVVALLLAIAWMAPYSVAPAPLGLAAIAVDRFRTRFVLSRTTVIAVAIVTAAIAATIAAHHEMRVFGREDVFSIAPHRLLGQFAAMNLILLLIATAIWRWSRHARWLGVGVAALLFVGSIALWDQRDPWTKTLESYPVGTNIWPRDVEPGATVYWYRDLIAPWLLLNHGNYYTGQQGSGAVFSRELTLELDKRRNITAILDFQEQICRLMNNLNQKQGSCEPDAVAVHTVCKEGGIDYMVLQTHLEGFAPIADFSTGVIENGYEKKFFLYRCSALKQG
jgi:hypothetical protein